MKKFLYGGYTIMLRDLKVNSNYNVSVSIYTDSECKDLISGFHSFTKDIKSLAPFIDDSIYNYINKNDDLKLI